MKILPQLCPRLVRRIVVHGMALRGLWFSCALLSGCSLDLGDASDPEVVRNSCESDDECPGDSFCSRSVCQQDVTNLPAFLLATTPPTGAGGIAGLTFFEVVDSIDEEITLPHVSKVEATVTGVPIPREDCVSDELQTSGVSAQDGTLAVRLTLTPRARLLGLPNPSIVKQSDREASSYGVTVVAPPGSYDIYVEPITTDGDCVRPPVLFLDQYLPSNIQPLPIELPIPQALGVTVRYPKKVDDLHDWSVSIVERDSGRLLSNEPVLGEPREVEEGLEYYVRLAFSQIMTEVGESAAEIVRLSPPKDQVAPTIYVERSIVDLFQDGQGLIDQLKARPKPVEFSGRVAIAGQAAGTPASVTFIATEVSGIPKGTVAGFSRTVETGENGVFEVDVLPGSYRVRVSPKDESLANTEIEMVVSDEAEEQHGRTLEVRPRRAIMGRLRNFHGDVISGVSVVAQPSVEHMPFNVLSIAQGMQSFAPGSVSGVSSSNGTFGIPADAGVFNVFARPQSSTGYAWFVDQLVTVEEEEISLGELRLPLPVVVEGEVVTSSPRQSVPDALIRAYAFVKDGQLVGRAAGEMPDAQKPPAEAEAVLPIAETRANAAGQYRLLLPSTFK